MKDLWGLSCIHLINKDDYRRYCLKNSLISDSGLFFKTTAETTYRYIKEKRGFEEAHTALEDAEIETEIFEALLDTKEDLEDGIICFPFHMLGETTDFIKGQKKKQEFFL